MVSRHLHHCSAVYARLIERLQDGLCPLGKGEAIKSAKAC